MIWLLIQNFGIRLISKEVYQKAGQPPDMKLSQTYKIISYISMPLWLLATAYSIFLPFKLGTIWFATGLIIFLLGLIVNTIASVNFATTPMNEPVTRGVYRYSRHPIYVALFLIYLRSSIASPSQVSSSVLEHFSYFPRALQPKKNATVSGNTATPIVNI